jgi:hypothetical protein
MIVYRSIVGLGDSQGTLGVASLPCCNLRRSSLLLLPFPLSPRSDRCRAGAGFAPGCLVRRHTRRPSRGCHLVQLSRGRRLECAGQDRRRARRAALESRAVSRCDWHHLAILPSLRPHRIGTQPRRRNAPVLYPRSSSPYSGLRGEGLSPHTKTDRKPDYSTKTYSG